MKKAVRLGFLDFTCRETRLRLLRRELELNAPFAPGLYQAVTHTTQGEPVLEMARIPDADLVENLAATALPGTLLDHLADAIAAMHAAQPAAGIAETPAARLHQVVAGNARAAADAGLDPAAIRSWQEALAMALDRAAPALDARAPLIRRAHGDLHLGNLLIWHGRPAPFDALEFDEALATIDPGYDLAFLLMDLDLHAAQGRATANRVLNRYVARTGDAGLAAGLPVFLSLRAMIRAHVEAARNRPCQHLLQAALAYLQPAPRPPFAPGLPLAPGLLLAIGGLMGTGKSTLARALAPALGPAPGALILRSDETRKRLHGVPPEDPLPPAAYTPEAHARTHHALAAAATAALAARHAVILDATFLDPAQARAAEALSPATPFLGLWLHAPLPELERRIAARSNDASDATPATLRAAAPHAAPPPGWIPIDATDAAAALRAARHHVQARIDLL